MERNDFARFEAKKELHNLLRTRFAKRENKRTHCQRPLHMNNFDAAAEINQKQTSLEQQDEVMFTKFTALSEILLSVSEKLLYQLFFY